MNANQQFFNKREMKVDITACGGKTRIKKLVLWHKILNYAKRDKVEIYCRVLDNKRRPLINMEDFLQIPFTQPWFIDNKAMSLHLIIIGSGSKETLDKIILEERKFDPREWDKDGFLN